MIIANRKILKEMYDKVETIDILKDMTKLHNSWQKHAGSSFEYFWLTQQFKYALVELVKRHIL